MFTRLGNLFKQYKFSIFVWVLCYLCFASFIFIFSYLYPYGADEFLIIYNLNDFTASIREYFVSYMLANPRIGALANNIILVNGKWLFLILNPIIQSLLITLIIILIKGRKPDFTSLKDIPLFLLTAIMAVFFIPKPDNTLFWIGGATNYSWSIIPFVLFLLFLRFVYEKQNIPKIKIFYLFFLFFACIITNMCNENTSLASLIISVLFIIYAIKRNFKNKYILYIMFSGLLIGTLLLFLAPGNYHRLDRFSNSISNAWFQASIFQKIIWHISKTHRLFLSLYCLPWLTFIFLCLEIYSTKLKSFKNNDFLFSVISFIIASFLVASLTLVPIFSSSRVFYSASVMYIISFLYMIKYFSEYYRLRIMAYCAMAAFIFFIIVSPFFALPYVHLYKQDKMRNEYIAKAKANNQTAYLWFLYQIDGLTSNYDIIYYDTMLDLRSEDFFNIKIKVINLQLSNYIIYRTMYGNL